MIVIWRVVEFQGVGRRLEPKGEAGESVRYTSSNTMVLPRGVICA